MPIAALQPGCSSRRRPHAQRPVRPRFFGTLVLCTLVVLSLVLPGGRGVGGLVAASGAALYIALAFGVTFARNIPLNEALAAATGAEHWNAFLAPWVFWNHIRTVGSLAAACLLALGFALDQRG